MFADILLEDNAELKVKLREKAMPVKEYHQVRLPHGHSKYSVRKAHLASDSLHGSQCFLMFISFQCSTLFTICSCPCAVAFASNLSEEAHHPISNRCACVSTQCVVHV